MSLGMSSLHLMYRLETLALVSSFLYVPFYFAALYAFLFKKEWIRIPG